MLNIFNGTEIVSAVASSGLGIFLTAVLTMFGAVVVAYIVTDYLHNKHTENLAKQLVDTANMAVQSIQSMITVAITAEQGMDITEKIVGKSASSAEKKTQ